MPQQQQLAQYNIGRMLYDLDDPEMADFIAQLDEVNGLEDRSEGFVWRSRSWPHNGASTV
jgi:hypothetical protein